MAIDKNSNGFTFGFATVMVIVVGTLLAIISMGLKEKQNKNAEDKKRIDILGAIQVTADRSNAAELFGKFIKESYVVDMNGVRSESGASAFEVDIQKDFRDKTKPDPEKLYPLFVCEKEGKTLYVVPMVGSGLWGQIWGFVAVEEDFRTIYGVKFDHKSETPGLGAEINQPLFQDRFNKDYGIRKLEPGAEKYFEVLKGGSVPTAENQVDGITGGTITSRGVEEMMNRTFTLYFRHFDTLGKTPMN